MATTRKPEQLHLSGIEMNKDTFTFSMITTGISSHVRYLLEEKSVRLLSLSLLSGEDLYENIHAMVCFFFLAQ